MRARVVLASLLALTAAHRARAETPEDTCIAAAESGQRLRKDAKLARARAAFASCARLECPQEVAARCTDWLADVDRATPTIVVGALDGHGKDVSAGTVTMDGAPLEGALAGRALAVDPGAHTLELVTPSGERAAEAIVVREGEKERIVTLHLPALAAQEPPRVATRPVPWTAWGAGALGVVGLGVFGGFAIGGLVDRDSSGCARGCSAGDARRVDAELAVADVGLVIGAVSLGAALVFFLARPTVMVRAAPAAAAPALVRW